MENKEIAITGVKNLLKVVKVFGGLPQLVELMMRKRWIDVIASAKDEFELLLTTDWTTLKAEWEDLDSQEAVQLKMALKEAFDLENDKMEGSIELILDGLHDAVNAVLKIKKGVELAKEAKKEAPVEAPAEMTEGE